MRDLNGNTGLESDRDRLVERRQQTPPFVTEMRGVASARSRHHGAQLDQLIGRRGPSRPVDQPAGQAERPRVERLSNKLLHRRQLRTRGRTLVAPHHGETNRAVSGQDRDIHPRSHSVDGARVAGMAVIERQRIAGGQSSQQHRPLLERRRTETAVADDRGRHSPAQLVLHTGMTQDGEVIVRVDVDEPGRHRQPRGVDVNRCRLR